jgi:hypothetical protein
LTVRRFVAGIQKRSRARGEEDVEMLKRERVGKILVSLGLTLLLIGFGRNAAQAQTRLVRPVGGGTIRVTKSGSYFLDRNLISALTSGSIISVTASNVTINLNGFSIIGRGGAGTKVVGINAPGTSGVTIVNGTITLVPGTGIVLGRSSTLAGVQLISNNVDGMDCISTCLVTNNIVSGNLGTGLNFGDASSGYQDNVIAGQVPVTNGTNLGHNICNNGLCPVVAQ